MSRSNHSYYHRQKGVGYSRVGADDDGTTGIERDIEAEEADEGLPTFFRMMKKPVYRKIQNVIYLIVMLAAIGTSIPEVDSDAAFTIYFSSDSSATNEGNFKIEWVTVAMAIESALFYFHNALNYHDRYEQSVRKGFSYLRWLDIAATAVGALGQVYIMECYLDLGGLISFSIVAICFSVQSGTQEYTNAFYSAYTGMISGSNPAQDVAYEVFQHRFTIYLHSWIPLLGVGGTIFAQGVYYGIHGTGSMPTLFKVYIGMSLMFLLALSLLSAAHNFRVGIWKSNWFYEMNLLFVSFAWKVTSFILVYWIMHNYNNLNYCLATPLNTVV